MDKFKVNLEIKYWVLILALVFMILSLGLYFKVSQAVDAMAILGIIGSNIALATLIYTAMNLHNVINHNEKVIKNSNYQHSELIELEKKKHASEIISKWQTPEMIKIVTKGYEIRNKVKKMEGKEIAEFLKSDEEHHQSLVCIFNYFEKIAHLIEYDVVHEDMLKDYFGDLVKIYYHCFKGFVEFKQREMNSNKVLSSFIDLAIRWQSS